MRRGFALALVLIPAVIVLAATLYVLQPMEWPSEPAAAPSLTPTPQPIARATPTLNARPAASPSPDPATNQTPRPVASSSSTPVATRIVGPRDIPPSPLYHSIPLRPDPALERLVLGYLGPEAASYGIVVKRLPDGAGMALNGNHAFYAASLFKIWVLYEVFKQRSLGLLNFDEVVTITPDYAAYDLGTLAVPVWGTMTVGEAIEAMITYSDNATAVLLQDRVGGWNIIQDLAALGLPQSILSTERLTTSASDMAALFEMMATGAAVSPQASQEMLQLLARQQINDRIPALLPPGTTVAHKTGNWDNETHDVGIVYSPKATYILAVLSEKPFAAKPIAELSRLVYNYFNPQ
ncbi:MAG: serine hydrolase [Chloroflexi bacterium]|nr:serine hydrolase [Chloroflexota bacterium]